MITAEGKHQTDDSIWERKVNPTPSWKMKRSETKERRWRQQLQRSFRLTETQGRLRQIHTQVSLLAELTDCIRLHGINSADFSTLYILQRREESERTCDECWHFKQLRLSSEHHGSPSHLCRCTSDRPDKSSTFLSDQTLFYKKKTAELSEDLTCSWTVALKLMLRVEWLHKLEKNRAYSAFHGSLTRCDGCEKTHTRTHLPSGVFQTECHEALKANAVSGYTSSTELPL